MSERPSSAYVLLQLEQASHLEAGALDPGQRAAMLALGALCDRDLNAGQGLDVIRVDRLAKLTGRSITTIDRTMRTLVEIGYVTAVVNRVAHRAHVSGESMTRVSPRNVYGYRVNGEAFR